MPGYRYIKINRSDVTEMVGDYKFNEEEKMSNSKLFSLNWVNVQSALVSSLYTAIIVVLVYVLKVGSIFTLEWKLIVDMFVLALIPGVISLLKAFTTTKKGNALGIIKVIPDGTE